MSDKRPTGDQEPGAPRRDEHSVSDQTNAASSNNAGHLSDDQLSEVIDGGAIDTAEADHLAGCPVCQARLLELESTVSLLQALPDVEPPRSYRLSPARTSANATEPSGLVARVTRWYRSGFPALRIATTMVVLLLISVTVIDLLDDDTSDQPDVEPLRTVQESTLAPTDAAESAPDFAAPAASDEDLAEDGEESEFTAAGGSQGEAETAISAASPSPEPAMAAVDEQDERDDGPSTWRMIQYGLLIVLAWLIVTWIGYERIKKRPDRQDDA